jgi:serine-type D-Ala-D-Ala carboxypeptidase/endopeptidase
LSSPGAFGWTPWVDRETGYIAILGMEAPDTTTVLPFAVGLQQQLKPLVEEAF